FNTAHTDIDLARPKPNEKNSGFLPEERVWVDRYLDTGFVDTFRQEHPGAKGYYSWWSFRSNARVNNVGWRIDYFLVSEKIAGLVDASRIHPNVTGSDHCPISLVLRA
ncbi:MAG: endonuclease/exonuclease/phosphatase family protein, partial [Candidatus Marinimicrobia bacterium]|nr:endonuclease/exonuclease/phosphatase family protein [Candidatus Neomarinimicrobiota bacterium]